MSAVLLAAAGTAGGLAGLSTQRAPSPGHVVTPSVATPAPPVPIPVTEPVPRVITVLAGEGLWDVAKRVLGDATKWPQLAALNQLRPPYALMKGQRLLAPPVRGS